MFTCRHLGAVSFLRTQLYTATEMSAALLNSGTFGVEVGVPVLDVAVGVGLEPLEELDGSDITARLPM